MKIQKFYWNFLNTFHAPNFPNSSIFSHIPLSNVKLTKSITTKLAQNDNPCDSYMTIAISNNFSFLLNTNYGINNIQYQPIMEDPHCSQNLLLANETRNLVDVTCCMLMHSKASYLKISRWPAFKCPPLQLSLRSLCWQSSCKVLNTRISST
jgi:hypothetical protein